MCSALALGHKDHLPSPRFLEGEIKGYGKGWVDYVDPKTATREHKELEGEFEGLALIDDDEEGGEEAAVVAISAAKWGREAAIKGTEAAETARDQAKEIKDRVLKERKARKQAPEL